MDNRPRNPKPFSLAHLFQLLFRKYVARRVTVFSAPTTYLLLDVNPSACKASCNFSAATKFKSYPPYYQFKPFHNNYKLHIILLALHDFHLLPWYINYPSAIKNIFKTSFKAVINSGTLAEIAFPPISLATSNAFPLLCLLLLEGLLLPGF